MKRKHTHKATLIFILLICLLALAAPTFAQEGIVASQPVSQTVETIVPTAIVVQSIEVESGSLQTILIAQVAVALCGMLLLLNVNRQGNAPQLTQEPQPVEPSDSPLTAQTHLDTTKPE